MEQDDDMSDDDLDSLHDRRRLLKLGAALSGGLIFGFGGLTLGQDDPKAQARAEEAAWKAALAALKRSAANGVAVIVSAADDVAGRAVLAEALEDLIPLIQSPGGFSQRDLAPMCSYLLEAVWVCASAQRAQAKPGETLVLLDPQGKRIAGAKVALDEPKEVEAALEKLLRGGERLKQRAKRARQDKATAALVKRLLGKEQQPRWDAHQKLVSDDEAFLRAAPALLEAMESASGEQLNTLREVFGSRFWQQQQRTRGFPYGVEWKIDANEPEPCPPCGMARPTMSGRTFLRFFAPGK